MAFDYLFKEFDPEIDAGDIREWLAKVFEGVGLTLGSHGMDDIPDAFDGL